MKSENALPCGLPTLEAELAETLKAITDCFETARQSDPTTDAWSNRRNAEFSSAVDLLKVSAELGLAIAKIKGEYNQNINVLHGEIWPPPRRAVAKPQTPEEGRPAANQG